MFMRESDAAVAVRVLYWCSLLGHSCPAMNVVGHTQIIEVDMDFSGCFVYAPPLIPRGR